MCGIQVVQQHVTPAPSPSVGCGVQSWSVCLSSTSICLLLDTTLSVQLSSLSRLVALLVLLVISYWHSCRDGIRADRM